MVRLWPDLPGRFRQPCEAEVHRQANIQLAKELAEKSQELPSVINKYDKLRQQIEASIAKTRNKIKGEI